ncbi:LLM class flavin-dependent oxidoreductase [Actinomadura barringtoniae]|nr:LLM class flavin-dependent oxidoreductase [Actinomadura barringtoniae]
MLILRFDLRNPPMAGVSMADRYAATLEMAEWAEQHGALAVVLSEHHGADDGYLPNPLLLAAAIAARTTTIRINIASLVGPFHHPLRLAEDLAILDHLSRGRIDPVISGGYAPHEFEMFGVPSQERPQRMTRLFRTLKQAWSGEPFEYEGRKARVTPPPYRQGGPTLTMGGSSEGAARRAARIADGFIPSEPAFWQAYVDECAKLGKPDPGPPLSTSNPTTYLADDVEAGWAELGPYFLHEAQSYGGWGQAAGVASPYAAATDIDQLRATGSHRILTPDQYVAELRAMGELAMAIVHPMAGGIPPERAWQMLHLLEDRVLTQV